jgi:hypothetical protein
VRLIQDFAKDQSDAVVTVGGETFVAAEANPDLVDQAEHHGVGILGLEGFLIDGSTVYPALSRIADFSRSGTSLGSFDSRPRKLGGCSQANGARRQPPPIRCTRMPAAGT